MKNTIEVSSKSLIIIGSSFISESLYSNYKRNGKIKVSLLNDINLITNKPDYIIDCTFDKNKQDVIFEYCNNNNIQKLLLLNHWERTDLPKSNCIILQSIIYDVYGNEHMSFNRKGFENNFDSDISYCNLISESIRRIHESKVSNLPHVYIPYNDNKIKFIHVDNLYDPINYMLISMNKNSVYSVYDDEKTIGYILSIIKNVIGYDGYIIELNSDVQYVKYVKSLDFNHKKNYLDYEIKRIYNYLKINNSRFSIY